MSTPAYPVAITGRAVLLVGGGPAAERRLPALLASGADVAVVAPEITAGIEERVSAGEVAWRARPFRDDDLAGMWLVVLGTGDPVLDGAVAEAADRRRILCTSGDADAPGVPATAPVIDPAIVRPGVALVGGGPGDPGLLTVRARRLLAAADVVVADRLGPRSVLDELGGDVEIVDASKIPYGRALPQAEINTLLVERARAGRFVVRLKGGDPFVFGRGFEEVIACREAGVPVTVVPGISSAIAAPAAAGVPVTHRGVTHELVVVSAHLPPGHPECLVDWAALGAMRGTIVLMMGVTHLAEVASVLVRHGRPPSTPVLVVRDATTPFQQVARADLASVEDLVRETGLRPPAVVVIGPVAGLVPERDSWRAAAANPQAVTAPAGVSR